VGPRLPDIFLSYSREDRETARRFAEAFEREGLSVWWDATLNPGEAFDEVTEKALDEAKAVVVLWSKHSVASRWVRAEATQAHESRTLVPVMIESCKRPIMFELTQTSDLSQWKGDPQDKAWQAYLAAVRRFVGKDGPDVAPPVARSAGRAKLPAKRMGAIAIVVGALLVAGAGYWLVNRAPGPAAQTAQVAIAATPGKVTLAVLPFVNLSSDPEQEYFSDGLTEEVLNQLAQVRDLRVTARTSSFSFKGKNEDMRVIGEKLGVDNLLEGSIRKDGKSLRITAQLINSKDGAHLWSQTYDRELSGVFALQEEIAKDVARALKIRLDVGELTRAQGGTTNIEAYDKYLRAETLWRGDGPDAAMQGAQLYREAVALDPAFSRAWFGLYRTSQNVLGWAAGDPVAVRKDMATAAERVVALAPDAWWTKTMLVDQFMAQQKWSEAATAAEAAKAAAPASANYCGPGMQLGQVSAVIPCFERRRQADPLNQALSVTLQELYDMSGRPAEAQKEYERSKTLAGDHTRADHWAVFRLLAGKEASPATIKAQFSEFMKGEESIHIQLNHEMVGKLEDKAGALAAINQALEEPANQQTNGMMIVALYADRYDDRDLALAALSRYRIDLGLNARLLWMHFRTNLRSDPRFKEILRKNGFVDYFRASGNWGDFCKPVGIDDFECH
jgi:TolB-like protein